MSLKDKNVVVTGGSRGLGLGLVEALVAHGARVTVVARDADAFESVRARLGVATISADVTDETAAHRILAEVRPDRGAERRRAPVFGSSSFRPLRHPEEKLAPLCVVIPMPQFPSLSRATPTSRDSRIEEDRSPAARTPPYSGEPGTEPNCGRRNAAHSSFAWASQACV
jgi:hypothetical protein